MASDPLAGHRVLGFDLETTGLNVKEHRIVQYALIGCESNGEEIHLESLINPRRKIPIDAQNIHGISDDDVRNLADFKAHVQTIHDAMQGAVIVGHNIERFDWPFLRTEFTRAGMLMPKPLAILDTLTIARKLRVPPSHKLQTLCQRFDISFENAHTAGADAAATLLLLHKMMAANPQHFRRPIEDIANWANEQDSEKSTAERLGPSIDDLPVIDGSQGWMRSTTDGIVIARGRNRGRTISEIEQIDVAYLQWLASPSGPLDEDARAILQTEWN